MDGFDEGAVGAAFQFGGLGGGEFVGETLASLSSDLDHLLGSTSVPLDAATEIAELLASYAAELPALMASARGAAEIARAWSAVCDRILLALDGDHPPQGSPPQALGAGRGPFWASTVAPLQRLLEASLAAAGLSCEAEDYYDFGGEGVNMGLHPHRPWALLSAVLRTHAPAELLVRRMFALRDALGVPAEVVGDGLSLECALADMSAPRERVHAFRLLVLHRLLFAAKYSTGIPPGGTGSAADAAGASNRIDGDRGKVTFLSDPIDGTVRRAMRRLDSRDAGVGGGPPRRTAYVAEASLALLEVLLAAPEGASDIANPPFNSGAIASIDGGRVAPSSARAPLLPAARAMAAALADEDWHGWQAAVATVLSEIVRATATAGPGGGGAAAGATPACGPDRIHAVAHSPPVRARDSSRESAPKGSLLSILL